ncbi:uncharacterized protein CCDC197 [Erythrolamprus reginae]|uniref:uncharacterized protein CCDC197 n=1 Tax=Erythrolamprus reginae TaxID=121349 RepID=UPI00396C6082
MSWRWRCHCDASCYFYTLLEYVMIIVVSDPNLLQRFQIWDAKKHVGSSEVLQPSRKTLQQLRFLKKKANNEVATADLLAKKKDIKMRLERVAECREELQQKDQNNRAWANGLQIFFKESDQKNERVLTKYKLEQKGNALRRKEIRTLKKELQTMKARQQELQTELAKYKTYERFLRNIVNLLPPDFWGYQESSVIRTLTHRHMALFSTNQDLKNHLSSQEENLEIAHQKCAAAEEEHNTMRFVLISKVSELQSKYDALKERNIDLINYIDNKASLSNQRTRELSKMLVGISDMAERCYMKHYGPLGEMTFQSKLDMIQEFIYEKTKMKKELWKPEYNHSASLFRIKFQKSRSSSK